MKFITKIWKLFMPSPSRMNEFWFLTEYRELAKSFRIIPMVYKYKDYSGKEFSKIMNFYYIIIPANNYEIHLSLVG